LEEGRITVEELVISFAGFGVYYDEGKGAWRRLSTVIPENMIRLNNGIACDFGAAKGCGRSNLGPRPEPPNGSQHSIEAEWCIAPSFLFQPDYDSNW
jgi:hypothetical protein